VVVPSLTEPEAGSVPPQSEVTAMTGTDRPTAWQAREIAERYLRDLERLLTDVDVDAVARIARFLCAARDDGGTIYIAGNGGSAATASHWANDLGKATKCAGRGSIRVMCLSDNLPWLTALANDEGYERVFAGQLENFAGPGDVLIVLSASGNSRNLVEAVDLANHRGLVTIALLGFDGGILKERVSDYVWLPTDRGAYGLVESGHAVLCDIVTTCLMEDTDAAFARAPLARQRRGPQEDGFKREREASADSDRDPRRWARHPNATADRHATQAHGRVPRPAVPRRARIVDLRCGASATSAPAVGCGAAGRRRGQPTHSLVQTAPT
jgi:D-sedoheptulose 7-phosphate isomerase